jgi:hypothetical protein
VLDRNLNNRKDVEKALYSIDEIKNLYLYKVNYVNLLKEIEQLKNENWHLKQLLQHAK